MLCVRVRIRCVPGCLLGDGMGRARPACANRPCVPASPNRCCRPRPSFAPNCIRLISHGSRQIVSTTATCINSRLFLVLGVHKGGSGGEDCSLYIYMYTDVHCRTLSFEHV